MSATKKDTRSRKYLLTINNPKEQEYSYSSIEKIASQFSIKYFAVSSETGSKGTFHYHVFLYYENAIKFSTIKKLFPTAHIATAVGTAFQNKEYLMKSNPKHNKKTDGSYEYKDTAGKIHKGINHNDTFYESGECPDDVQGKRTDLEEMYEFIKDGYTNAEILELCPITAIKNIDKLDKLRLNYLTDKYKSIRRTNLKVHYIFGVTGKGKTRGILNEYGDSKVYRVTDWKHPFDMYQMQPVICFDEYRSSLQLANMLNYLDIYPINLEARYSPKTACYETAFVVSNESFESQYPDVQKDPEKKQTYEAWVRRFNGYVKHYKETGIVTYPTMQDYLKKQNGIYEPYDKSQPSIEPVEEPQFSEIEDEEVPFKD